MRLSPPAISNAFFGLVAVGASVGLLLTEQSQYLPPLLIGLANLALAAFVLLSDRQSRTNFNFALTATLAAGWTVSIFMYSLATTEAAALYWSQLAAAFAALIPAVFFYFTHYFSRDEWSINFPVRLAIKLSAVVFAVLSFSRFIVAGTTVLAGRHHFLPGMLFPLFLVYFIGLMLFSFYRLAIRYQHSAGALRLQIGYIFFAFLVGTSFPIVTNLILPLSGYSDLAGIGPLALIITLGIISYTIIRHRLMSIEIVIQRGVVYAIATVLIMSLYALAVMTSELYLRRAIGYNSVFVTALAALALAALYQPVIRLLQQVADRLFFRGRYNYQKTLRHISQELAAVIRLDQLVKLVVTVLNKTMQVSESAFLLAERGRFRSLPLELPGYKQLELDANNPLIARLIASRAALSRDELTAEPELRAAMERLGVAVWLPIISQEQLIGLIALGDKLSGDSYSTEDLALLATLASQTAVALENARLYDEVLAVKNYNEEVLRNMTSGVLTTDTRGQVVTFNPMAEKITGRAAAAVIGRSCVEVWGERGALTQVVMGTLHGRACLNYETGLMSPERGLVPVAFSSVLLRNNQEKKSGALLLIQDLTERKELEDKIRRADKLTALATMAAGMAHEIKNPLSSMKVFAQLLPLKINDPEYRQKLGEIMPREIDRIDRIVENLLGFARSTALTFVRLPITELLEDDLRYFADKAADAGVRIVRRYAELPPVEIDREQLSQVFSNLILNALQAMPEGGELTVTTAPGKTVDEQLQSIRVSIADTGHGISPEMQKKLFDPFFTTKYGGTGLGLTVSHSIVDGHKGFIDLESKLGQGTTFTVTLPVSQGLL
ncbi:MAG: ATP-binding protein [Candidatus Margulisbacteria bacterium]|jgi:PAS domain S-box-containing protein|nr:ATP-binding protein [Candidatus Margulisiibacteriota bacterium]